MKNKLIKITSLILIIAMIVIGTLAINNEEIIKIKTQKEEINGLQTTTKFKEIAAGIGNSFAIDSNGNLWAWGQNADYSLGDGTNTKRESPIKVLEGKTFSKVATSGRHTLAIDTNNNLWAWGGGPDGQLGNGLKDTAAAYSKEPIQIMSGTKFKEISVGLYCSMALDTSNNLWFCGGTEYESGYSNTPIASVATPIKIKSGVQFKEIAAGYNYSLAIDNSGNLWSWGYNYKGQLGNGTKDPVHASSPVQVKAGTKFSKVSAGNGHSIAIDISGNLYTWGENDNYGQLGDGTMRNSSEPILVKTGIKEIKTGSYNTMAIDNSGVLWACGNWIYSGEGTLENNWRKRTTTPAFNQLALGSGHGLAIDSNNDLWVYGTAPGNGLDTGLESNKWVKLTIASTYTVTFKNGTTTVSTQEVNEGENATAPSITKAGYTLSWDKSYTNITSDITVNAVWTANTNTAYKVEHYQQNTSLNGYTLKETESRTGTTDTTATATAKTYTGFKENTSYSGRITSGKINGNGTLTLKLYYDRETYNVTLTTNGGKINSGDVTNYAYGVAKNLPTNVTKAGYTFAGWYTTSSLTGTKVTSISATETGAKTYYAKWTANTNTAYKVEHYQQNTSLNGYTLVSTDSKTGTTDTTATATAKTYTGFKENIKNTNRVPSGTITGDGNLTLKLYYDREIYGVTLNTNGGKINSGNITDFTYGISKALPTNVTREGYTFDGWYTNSSLTGTKVTSINAAQTGAKTYYAKWTPNTHSVTFKDDEDGKEETKQVTHGNPVTPPNWTKPGYEPTWDGDLDNITEDTVIKVIWVPKTNTPYTVEYYIRSTDLEVETYTLKERIPLTGTTGQTVNAEIKEYTGFIEDTNYAERKVSGPIAGDGSLTLKVYYKRNQYGVTLNTNGGRVTTGNINSYIYGIEEILPTRVTKEGYIFAGWYDNEALSGTPITKIGAEETGDKTYYAKWATNIYTVTFKDDEDGKEETKQVAGGNPVTPPNWTKPGYEPTWDGDLNNITEDTTIKVIWVPKTNTPYTVEYYLRSTDSEVETYTLKEAVPLTGTTGQTVNAEIKEYTGFTENTNYAERKVTGTILADGSLTLKVYYTRNQYDVTLNTNGGRVTTGNINSYTYGIEEVLPTRVTKNGYIFVGWYDNAELSGNPITKIGAGETEAKTYYAKWATEDEYYITSEVYSIDFENNYITKVSPYTNAETFMNNITTNGTKKVVNAKGEEVSTEALVGTGYKLQVTYKGIVHEYEIAVRGDVDGNGEVTVTDLSMVNQSIVQSLTLTGVKKIAADTDYNGEITVTDLSMVNQAITGKIKL